MIGIIDSGYGGLSVVRELVLQQKNVPFIYIGDNARNPYGTKTKEEITQYGKEMIDYLLAHYPQIDTMIIACNTLCVAALPELNELYPKLMIEPITRYGCLSALMSFDKHVTVIATKFTIESNLYQYLIHKYDSTITVQQLDAQPLVTMVEEQKVDLSVIEALSEQINLETDTLILGCTHFPFLYTALRKTVSENIQIVDPAVACVADLEAKIDVHWQAASRSLTTGSVAAFAAFVHANDLPNLPIENIILAQE